MGKYSSKWAVVIVLFVAAILFFLQNSAFVFNGDDLIYQYSYATGEHVNSLSDVVASQIAHYYKMNGRIIPHLTAQFIFSFQNSKVLFDVFNTIIFVLVVYGIGYYTLGKDRHRLFSPYVLSILSVFYIFPGRMWEISYAMVSFNYLYVSLYFLLFLAIFDRLEKRQCRLTHWSRLLVFIIGLICGLTHEAFVVGMSGALILYCAYKMFVRQKIYAHCLLAGFLIGTIILVTSPGILNRADDSGVLAFDIKGKLINVALALYHLKLFYVLLCLSVLLWLKDKRVLYVFFRENSVLFLSMLLSLGFVAVFAKLYYTNDRAVYGVEFMSLLLIIRLINRCFVSYNISYKAERIFSLIVFVLFVLHQILILPVAYAKWNIHRQVRRDYLRSKDGVVSYPNYNYSSLAEPYTIDLKFNYGDGFGTHMLYAEMINKSDNKEGINSPLVMNEDLLGSVKHVVDSMRFITIAGGGSFIAPYSERIVSALDSGKVNYVLKPVFMSDISTPLPLRVQMFIEKLLGKIHSDREQAVSYVILRSPSGKNKYVVLPKPEYREVEDVVVGKNNR